jgi:predicted regulator of Ras-like GTPase activity (Roadblock/LC7/MglB family)
MSTNDAFQRILAPLGEVPGVEGVFVLTVSGSVVARDSKLWLGEDVLASVSARIVTLFEAVNDNFDEVGELTLAFDPYTLALRRNQPFILAALVRPTVNGEAVRMASNIALRQLQQRSAAPPIASAQRPQPPPRAMPDSARASSPKIEVSPEKPAKKKKSDIWG